MKFTESVAWAIVRDDGWIQKTYDVRLGATQMEVYASRKDAQFVRDKAYPGQRVVMLKLNDFEEDD